MGLQPSLLFGSLDLVGIRRHERCQRSISVHRYVDQDELLRQLALMTGPSTPRLWWHSGGWMTSSGVDRRQSPALPPVWKENVGH